MALPTWIAAHKADPVRATFWLVKLGLASPLYLTDCDQPIFWDSQAWTAAPLTVDGFQTDLTTSSGNGGRLRLASGGAHWQPLLAAMAGGSRDFEVSIWEAWLDTSIYPSAVTPADAVRAVAVTKVEAAEWDREFVSLTLGPSSDPALGRLPFREYQSSLCTYRRFKGLQCAYAGVETECDRTYARCVALGNEERYGGIPVSSVDQLVVSWTWDAGESSFYGEATLTLREA